jgi:hypothetical protein
MTFIFFMARIFIIPIYWYKVYSISSTPDWIQTKHLRYLMVITCLALDCTNIYWFMKMLHGAKIVWSQNWQYYSEHHKKQQINRISSYCDLMVDKLLVKNNSFCKSTLNSVNRINKRWINSDFIDRNTTTTINNIHEHSFLASQDEANSNSNNDSTQTHNDQDMNHNNLKPSSHSYNFRSRL